MVIDEEGVFCSICGNPVDPMQVIHVPIGKTSGCHRHFIAFTIQDESMRHIIKRSSLPEVDLTHLQRPPKIRVRRRDN